MKNVGFDYVIVVVIIVPVLTHYCLQQQKEAWLLRKSFKQKHGGETIWRRDVHQNTINCFSHILYSKILIPKILSKVS